MKKLLGLMVCLLVSIGFISGCGNKNGSDQKPTYGGNAAIKIAVLGSKEQFDTRKDFLVGMDLAIEELEKSGVTISYDLIDDKGSSDTGVGLAKDVVKNNDYTMAFTMEEADTVDSIAAIFDAAKKPLLIVDKVYNSTMRKGYDYVLAGTVSAEKAGKALADYCAKLGIDWVASSHSETKYETALAREFNNAVDEVSYLMDSVSGPYKMSDVVAVKERWNILGVQAALVSFEDTDWTCELVAELKKTNPNLLILTDSSMNDESLIAKYKEAFAGTILVGTNKINSEDKLQGFYDKYDKKVKDKIGSLPTSVTAQAFDFVNMVAQNIKRSNDVDEFMKNMKSNEEYEGVTGIKFDAYGYLDEIPGYWTIKEDGLVYRVTE